MPQALTTELAIDIPFVPLTEDTVPEDDMDEVYAFGEEVNLEDTGEGRLKRSSTCSAA